MDAPERIWACMDGPMVGLFVSGGYPTGWPEYVRADLHTAALAEVAKLRDACNQARLAFAGYVSAQSAINKLDALGETP